MAAVEREALEQLLESASKGNLRSIGRFLTLMENPYKLPSEIFDSIARMAGKAHVIGITGIPGAGKSTLISKLIIEFRRRGYKVAVIAIDPSSPLTGGALLGDRLRMQERAEDPGIFIRSVSTRGLKGGLSLAALSMIEALDALGYDKIIIETVGVGQSETDVMNTVHTVVVVTMPGVGDDIQALKAGVMEIGDIYVLNKSDMPGAQEAFEYLSFAIDKGELGQQNPGWKPRLLRASAVMGSGIADIASAIEDHMSYLRSNGMVNEKVVARRLTLVRLMAERMLADEVQKALQARIKEVRERVININSILEVASELARDACSSLSNASEPPRR
ncbi:Transport system kinase [Acidilobus saccharovorans 345-15]|uniref:Transport system kinase n=1 Tax=Acidilobus saccharovorans (strain DSM 16705 / JCM 18335 / VKM B-2471 / 345-15) TaxID=666510 RepID=D9Q2E6_ACIS3|nr:Transport system kinase [Acidilobus saccharovorans 345-15]